MSLIAVTQRVCTENNYRERRDALDQRWWGFLSACGLIPVPLPNNQKIVRALLDLIPFSGFLLTGGGDLKNYGGLSPERDETEKILYEYAVKNDKPLIGVCRGMQFIQNYHGIRLSPVSGHICEKQEIICQGQIRQTNSYHALGATQTRHPYETWAQASDGVIKAMRHENKNIIGLMWHPERQDKPDQEDIKLFKKTYEGHHPSGRPGH